MKKIILSIISLAVMHFSFAQGGATKEVLLVDYFTHGKDMPEAYVDMLRNSIIGGLQETGRLSIVDVDTEYDLKVEAERRTSEGAISDNAARTGAMKTMGAKYLLSGQVAEISAVKKQASDGSISYDGVINFTLKVTNVADGSIKVSKQFTYSGLNAKSGSTAEQAVLATTDYIKISMKKFVNDNFKLESTIVLIESSDSKKGALTVYIDCGEAVGIKKAQLFDVKVEKEVAGRTVQTLIGKLRVEDVQGDDMSLCKVTKGGTEIQQAFNDNRKLVIISAGTGGLGGLTGAAGSLLK